MRKPLPVPVSLVASLVACIALPASAQQVTVTRGVLDAQPYTLIYPETMTASGGGDDPIVISHTAAPLQCNLVVMPVEDTDWTPRQALETLDEAAVTADWQESFPGFTLGESYVGAIQGGEALAYDGSAPESPFDMPVEIVHFETIDNGRGYVLDCIYATEFASEARPVVDFITGNFATRSDADCCAEPATP